MNEFRFEMLSLNNVEKYSVFFEKEIKIASSKDNIINENDCPWLIEKNSIEYMQKILD
jgi:hypothetical protein